MTRKRRPDEPLVASLYSYRNGEARVLVQPLPVLSRDLAGTEPIAPVGYLQAVPFEDDMVVRGMVFQEVNTKVSFPAVEAEIEAWWRERDIVRKALQSGDPATPFIFFEGPPTANGRPGVHHVEARASKDIIVRFHRMRGEYVIGARGGWDTHGLPVEIEVEKELGFKGKPDIEKYGIAKFNEACKASVWRYIQDWERMTTRVAYWIDLDNPYITYENSYIESLWWILKTFWDRDLLYRDYKVTMHCPRCGTSLSDHEVAQGFQDDVDDPSVWIRFRHSPSGHPLDGQLAGASFIAWTTTPWTLPANVALAVKPNAAYPLVEYTGGEIPERLILAEALVAPVLGEGNARVLATFDGNELRDVRYQPLFQGIPAPGQAFDPTEAYRVVADDYVSLEDGTGIVHIAPAYGDLEIGRKYDLPTLFSVDLAGNTLPEFDELGFGSRFFKEADPLITQNLQERDLLLRSGRVRHSYPFCWRCGTPLLYYAKPSWYIRTTARKAELLANNATIHWVPEHIKNGRFGNWLEQNIDWALSRERYWGTPLPIWVCDSCGQVEVVGSVAELSERAGRDLSQLDLHRPYLDEVTWACTTCPQGGTLRRVPDVADAWFDSGSMPVAQWHYPFENQEIFTLAAQADFISEAIDQTRGWFYTLHAVSTLLFDRAAYKNVICLGLILDINGDRMSKSRGNAVDPWQLLDNYGADATRWYMYASAPPYNPRRFAPEQVGEMVRRTMLTLWNTYSFFVTYANIDGWQPSQEADPFAAVELQPIDRWALARLNALVTEVASMLAGYDIHGPTREINAFIDDLSNWYVRRNRRRFWKAEGDADKAAAYQTLYTCLTTLARLLAPFMPFISEAMYQNLVAGHVEGSPESVHLTSYPEPVTAWTNQALLRDTALLMDVTGLARAARKAANLRIRQPLSEMLVRVPGGDHALQQFTDELRDELNVKSVQFIRGGEEFVEYRLKPNLPVIGRQYGRLAPKITEALTALSGSAASQAVAQLEAGESLGIQVDGQEVELAKNDVLISTTSPQGYAVAEENGVLVALNTTLTPDLILEGAARDLVRLIQDARKGAGCAITDRIEVNLLPEGEQDLEPLLQTYGTYIRAETLADSLVIAPPSQSAYTTRVDLLGGPVGLSVQRS